MRKLFWTWVNKVSCYLSNKAWRELDKRKKR